MVAEVGTAFIGPFLELGGMEKFPAFFRNKRAVARLNERIEEIEADYRNGLIARETRRARDIFASSCRSSIIFLSLSSRDIDINL